MVTLIKYGTLSGGEKYNVNVLNLDGLSSDIKPTRTFIEYGSDGREVGRTGIPNGSLYTEIDTGDTYMYDTDNTTWHKVSLGGGGTGGGGGFTPTTAQLDAMNSGIDSIKVQQIATNENNILLKANTSDVNTATANLQAQIDNIITPATQDAEVENARVGINGTSYQTLKARLDAESTDYATKIGDIDEIIGNNLHVADGEVTLAGSWKRATVISQVALSANVEYRFTFTPSETVNKNGYGYIYDSTGTTEIKASSSIKNVESVFVDYKPQTDMTVMVKAAVEGTSVLGMTCSVDNNDGNNIQKLDEKVSNLFDGDSVVDVSYLNGYYVTVATGYEGEIASDTNSCATSFINVMPNDTIKLDNLSVEGNRSVCAYNKNRQYIATIISHSNVIDYTFTVPSNCYYIRATGAKNISPKVTYLSLPQTLNEIKAVVPIISNITNGYYITKYTGYQGETAEDENSAVTDYIPIKPNSIIAIGNAYIGGNRSVCCYDKNKIFVSVLMANNAESKFSTNIKIPDKARYIRITSRKDIIPTVKYENYIIDNSNVKFQYTNKQLFDSATLKPVLTFIDDDTWDVQYVTRHKELCDSLGIKLSFACLTSRLADNEPLQTLLHSYERQGFPIIYHAYAQGNYYNTPTLDTVAEEDDFVHGLQDMHKYGFVDYKIWCTPFGGARADEIYLARKWGMNALITSGRLSTDINNPYNQSASNRYCIYRISLDSDADVDGIKSAIDAAIACDGWVVISTHSAYEAYFDGSNDDAMSEIVEYARANGVEIRTVNEELRRRMPIYNYYEQF